MENLTIVELSKIAQLLERLNDTLPIRHETRPHSKRNKMAYKLLGAAMIKVNTLLAYLSPPDDPCKTTAKGLYDKLYPNTKPKTELLSGKLYKSPFGASPCKICHRPTVWFRQDLNARICSEQCANTAAKQKTERTTMKIALIGSTRYAHMKMPTAKVNIENAGHEVRLPTFDGGAPNELALMDSNLKLIKWADKVIVFWDGRSMGTWGDIAMAYALNKPISIGYLEPMSCRNFLTLLADRDASRN